jgi:hypothetical protein
MMLICSEQMPVPMMPIFSEQMPNLKLLTTTLLNVSHDCHQTVGDIHTHAKA